MPEDTEPPNYYPLCKITPLTAPCKNALARPLDPSYQMVRSQSWQKQARECLLTGLHYHPRLVDLQAETIETL